MTQITPNQETPATNLNVDDGDQRISRRRSRHNRSLTRSFKRHLQEMLPAARLFRAGVTLLLLAAFVHVSLINDVFGPSREGPSSLYVEASDSIGGTSSTNGAKSSNPDPLEDWQINHSYALANWVSDGVDSSQSVVVSNVIKKETTESRSGIDSSDLSTNSVQAPRKARYFIPSEPDVAKLTNEAPTVHVVNEGGSLWRTIESFYR